MVCMDAPKNHIMVPCMHVCACEECVWQLLERGAQNLDAFLNLGHELDGGPAARGGWPDPAD